MAWPERRGGRQGTIVISPAPSQAVAPGAVDSGCQEAGKGLSGAEITALPQPAQAFAARLAANCLWEYAIFALSTTPTALSRDIVPRKFEHPEHAVASLQDFFRAETVGESIDNGTARLPEIRLLFSRGQDGQLSPGRRQKALELLITAADEQDWRLISPVFAEIVNGDAKDLLPTIAQACLKLVWSTASKKLVGDYLRLVTPYGLADALLAELVAPAGSVAGQLNGCDTAAALLAEFVMDHPASYPPDARGTDPKPGRWSGAARTPVRLAGQPPAHGHRHRMAGTCPRPDTAAVQRGAR
jgi:hypothetical protein